MKEQNLGTIAFVSTMDGVPWGGSEELWSQTAARLVSSGYRVGVNLKQWPETPHQACELQRIGCEVEYRRPLRRVEKLVRRLTPSKAAPWLERFGPDLVVISQGGHYDGYEWAEECIARGLPYVMIAQAACEAVWPTDEQALVMERCYAHAAASYFVSYGNLNLMRRQIVLDPPNVKVVRNPFNVPYDVAPEWPADDTVMSLACVGRLEPKAKGQDILFEVMADPKWRQRPIQVTLYGGGPNGRTLEAHQRQLGLENVTFGGFCADIAELWTRHHALILPSRHEGLPLALIEAMLCGRPSIVTDVAGNAEVVEDGVSGFVAAAPVPSCLDEALERAWQRRADWKQMGQAAARRVRELVPRDPIAVFAQELVSLLPCH